MSGGGGKLRVLALHSWRTSASIFAKQLAVAGRSTLSEAVADALVAHGSEDVVVAVVSNPGAALAESLGVPLGHGYAALCHRPID